MSKQEDRALAQLARMYNVDTSYEDVAQRTQEASQETMVLTLRALGAPLTSAADAPNAVKERKSELAVDTMEPVVVAWSGRLFTVPIHLASAAANPTVRFTIRFETGEMRSGTVRPEPLSARSAQPGAATHRIRIGPTLPLGYHDIEIETADRVLTARIISSPRKAHSPLRQADWGVFMPLHAVRGADDWGVGSYTDLDELARWTAARGGSFVGTLPLLASFVDVCFEPSPYAPVSRMFWNELFVDVTRAPGWSPSIAHDPRGTHADRDAFVDYREVGHRKLQALRQSAERYFAAGDTAELDRYVNGHERVRDYARFRAVLDRRRESWHVWPERLRNGDLHDGDFAAEDERYHQYAQWVADTQIDTVAAASRKDSASLYLDLPLGVSPDGYDAWRERGQFAADVSTGAPPDALFTGGQDWGFRPPQPHVQRMDGHRYFIDSLRHHLRHAGMLRLDHVMALHRLYWIPAGLDARQGAYVRYPADELFAIITLESTRHSTTIVGEDLGTVPREVREQMDKRGVLRMYVVQYELSSDSDETIAVVPEDVVASVNTHDMPTLRGFVSGSELRDQLDLGLVDEATWQQAVQTRSRLVQRLAQRFDDAQNSHDLMRRVLGYLAASPARAMLINLEDLWLEPAPQNVPGTNKERPNWRRRSRFTLDQITGSQDIRDILASIDRTRAARGRAQVEEGSANNG